MDQNEVVLRAIGVLTHATELKKQLEQGKDPDVSGRPFESLMDGILYAELNVSEDARPQEVIDAIKKTLDPAVTQLAVAFAQAFQELAEIHDAGRTDVSSDEVLRQLALRLAS